MGKKLIPNSKHFNLTNQAFNSLFDSTAWREVSGWKDAGKEYLLVIDLPGMHKKDICVETSCSYVTISAERKIEDKSGHSCESYTNLFSLPDDIDDSSIKAKYENNQLILSVDKKLETVSCKKIDVK